MSYSVINLATIYKSIGEMKTKEIIGSFKCDLNKDIEYFLKEKSIEFFKQGIAETFIVTSSYKGKEVVVGYFALASKTTKVKKDAFGGKTKRRFARFAQCDIDNRYFLISLPLIGQIGKNYNNQYNKLISGDELLKLACDKVREAQYILGGRFVFLECEDKPKLKEFYEDNRICMFWKKKFGKR